MRRPEAAREAKMTEFRVVITKGKDGYEATTKVGEIGFRAKAKEAGQAVARLLTSIFDGADLDSRNRVVVSIGQ